MPLLVIYLILHKLRLIHTIVHFICAHKSNFHFEKNLQTAHIKLIKQYEFDKSFICCLTSKVFIQNTWSLLPCRVMFLYWLLTDCRHTEKMKWPIFLFEKSYSIQINCCKHAYQVRKDQLLQFHKEVNGPNKAPEATDDYSH